MSELSTGIPAGGEIQTEEFDLDAIFDADDADPDAGGDPIGEVGAEDEAQSAEPAEPSLGLEQGAGQTPAEELYTLRHNHEDIQLTRQQLMDYAQQGLAFPDLRERFLATQNDPLLAGVREIAQRYGMEPERLLEGLRAQAEQTAIQQQMSRGVPEDVARELYQQRQQLERLVQAQEQGRQQAAQLNEIQYIRANYPEILAENGGLMPPGAVQMIREGKSPSDAMDRYAASYFKSRAAIGQQTERNKRKSPGSALGVGSGGKDAFDAAWDEARSD
ncbi:MAG: hypothetical protein LBD02_10740 [Christensenellaceae bacterium]|jgi:hypothetical protein|nr:hypothetical protein [Christensenellaceae bacterium]